MIKIYKLSDFKKHGGLKKSARGLFFNNTDEHGKDDRYARLASLIKAEGYASFSSPYSFTHINATHPEHGQVAIMQEVAGLTCSPTTLYKELTK